MNTRNIYNCLYKESSCGIGDFLRGSCFLFEALKTYDVNFDIDLTFHPIKQYFKNINSNIIFNISDIIDIDKNSKKCNQNYIHCLVEELKNALNLEQENIFISNNFSDILLLEKEEMINFNLSSDCQDFFKKKLQFTNEIIEYANEQTKNIKNYDIFHFRCGDYELVKQSVSISTDNLNNKNYNIDYNNCLNSIHQLSNNPLVISDSNNLKKFLENNGIDILHKHSQHSSINPGILENIEYDDNALFYTALDMYLMSKARKIYSYSVYPWGSGFCFWISKIFNIPIQITTLL